MRLTADLTLAVGLFVLGIFEAVPGGARWPIVVGRHPGLAFFARQKRAERPQVQVEVFDGETEVVPQLGHPGFQGHQGRSDRLDLIVRERPLFHPAQSLTLHQLAQQLDEGENQGRPGGIRTVAAR